METAVNPVALEDPPVELVVLEEVPRAAKRKIVLLGHPNVGKSLIFSLLTSRYATVSNFPGTTVEIFRGEATIAGQSVEVIDTPGIHNMVPTSEDEHVTVRLLEIERPDLVVQVADAKNLRRTLLLTAQLSSFGIPQLLVLNMMDECEERGISINARLLAQELGIPVVQTIATTGEGIDHLRFCLGSQSVCLRNGSEPVAWVEQILRAAHYQGERSDRSVPLQTRLFAALSLGGAFIHLENYFGAYLGWPTLAGIIEGSLSTLGLPALLVATLVTTGAYLLPVLVPLLAAISRDQVFNERLGVWARQLTSGLLILGVTISLTFQLVGNLGAQVFVEVLEAGLFEGLLLPWLRQVVPAGFANELLVGQFGLVSVGVTYGVAIVLPVVATFFIAFSFLEDSGYLPRLSILSDRLLRSMGLHGKAFLPMVLGLGCVTMATMTTRILNTRKERLIATLLLALGVPCSAQLGVIMGITAGISLKAILIVFGTVAAQLVLVGWVLSRLYPGQRSSFILEIPPIRRPVWSNILRKTYLRVWWFLKEALPLFILGSAILFALQKANLLQRIIVAVEPIVTRLLGLPREAATVFLLGFLRRDYGAAGLFDLARHGSLDGAQIVVGLVVMTLFVPCIANFLVMIKEQGWKVSALMVGFVFTYAVFVGSVLNLLLRTLSISI